MINKKRIQNQSCWILHHRPYRETSNIIDVFTKEFGRISLIAKGARSAKSKFRGLLRPFSPLSVSWISSSNLGTLIDMEVNGNPILLFGDSLLSGYYLNELIIKLLHKDDSQNEIFDLYTSTIIELSKTNNIAPILRNFEIDLLKLIGYEINLDSEYITGDPLEASNLYEYSPGLGFEKTKKKTGLMIFHGDEIQLIKLKGFQSKNVLKSANRLLRNTIAFHLDGKILKTRKVLEELRKYDK